MPLIGARHRSKRFRARGVGVRFSPVALRMIGLTCSHGSPLYSEEEEKKHNVSQESSCARKHSALAFVIHVAV
jgi:hypothetical protein